VRWIMLLFTSFVSVLFAFSVYAWRDLFKTERVVRPYIDDIPFQPIAIVTTTDIADGITSSRHHHAAGRQRQATDTVAAPRAYRKARKSASAFTLGKSSPTQ
jgi:hypothetical protein